MTDNMNGYHPIILRLCVVFVGIIILIVGTPLYAASHSSINAKIQAAINASRIKNRIPAIQVSVSLPGEYSTRDFVSGTQKYASKTTVTTGNLFQIGSITKSFVAAVILQLEAAGKLSLSDRIGQYIDFSSHPAWPSQWKLVTIKQLLNMTSGIYDYTDDEVFFNTMLVYPKKLWTPSELIDVAAKHPRYFSPGAGWHYSNTDYILVGMIIRNVTGKSLAQALRKRLLGPVNLNLLNTYYSGTNYAADIVHRTVHGYFYVYGILRDVTSPTTSCAGAAGGILSNTRDITRWVRALFSGQVLKKQQLSEMKALVCMGGSDDCVAGQPTTTTVGGYGLGLIEQYAQPLGQIWQYEGGNLGYQLSYVWIPAYDTIITVTGDVDGTPRDYLNNLISKILKILSTSPQWQNYRYQHHQSRYMTPLKENIINTPLPRSTMPGYTF